MDKTQNSRKKLKLWEDFSAPERPSDVKTKSLRLPRCLLAPWSWALPLSPGGMNKKGLFRLNGYSI